MKSENLKQIVNIHGIQTLVKSNKLSSVMAECRHGFYNGVMAHMLQFGESTIQPAIACSKLTTETLEQGVKYVQT